MKRGKGGETHCTWLEESSWLGEPLCSCSVPSLNTFELQLDWLWTTGLGFERAWLGGESEWLMVVVEEKSGEKG